MRAIVRNVITPMAISDVREDLSTIIFCAHDISCFQHERTQNCTFSCGIHGTVTGNTSKTCKFSLVCGETVEILTICYQLLKPMIYPVKLLGFVVITAEQIFKVQNRKGKVEIWW